VHEIAHYIPRRPNQPKQTEKRSRARQKEETNAKPKTEESKQRQEEEPRKQKIAHKFAGQLINSTGRRLD
jgi:hypothetical protein